MMWCLHKTFADPPQDPKPPLSETPFVAAVESANSLCRDPVGFHIGFRVIVPFK